MTHFEDSCDFQPTAVMDKAALEDAFTPEAQFRVWLQAVEIFRNRVDTSSLPGVYVESGRSSSEDALSFYDHFKDKISSEGTLVVTEHGQLQADVEVTEAMIDGVFKGKITATRSVTLDNHAIVVGEIYTPELVIRGGAIIEGRIRFDKRPQTSWERPRWEALKVGFAHVWRGRIFF